MFPARRSVLLATRLAAREVHATAAVRYPRGTGRDRHGFKGREEGFNIDDIPDFEEDDATSAAHIIIHQQKQILDYMRLIERDGPRLHGSQYIRSLFYTCRLLFSFSKTFHPAPGLLTPRGPYNILCR